MVWEVEFYGLRGWVVVCVVGSGGLDVVIEWKVYFGFDAFVM